MVVSCLLRSAIRSTRCGTLNISKYRNDPYDGCSSKYDGDIHGRRKFQADLAGGCSVAAIHTTSRTVSKRDSRRLGRIACRLDNDGPVLFGQEEKSYSS